MREKNRCQEGGKGARKGENEATKYRESQKKKKLTNESVI